MQTLTADIPVTLATPPPPLCPIRMRLWFECLSIPQELRLALLAEHERTCYRCLRRADWLTEAARLAIHPPMEEQDREGMIERDHYVVLRLSEHLPLRAAEYHHFESAHDAALFMWGRSVGKHLIYKNMRLAHLHHLYADIGKLEKYLMEFDPHAIGGQEIENDGTLYHQTP